MNIEQLLLIKLMEECAEVQQACSKALRFSLYEQCSEAKITNAEYIQEELLDMFAVLHVLHAGKILATPILDPKLLEARITRIKKYMSYSSELGILE